jgi:hypothetical protein
MSIDNSDGLSSSRSVRQNDPEALQLAEFWNALRACDELDPSVWEVLEPIERQVTECLDRPEPLYATARSLTAQVMILLSRR